jgi:hypothetical protein
MVVIRWAKVVTMCGRGGLGVCYFFISSMTTQWAMPCIVALYNLYASYCGVS